ncbi:hypothetical protein [Paraburkholderia sp. Ac-20347]|uniref:hypothetical protein n=1 Tax=Paraburkholderia sp. Ac-20347 TaxID=2703892 RepID=UPI00197E31AD|nr:hypothetical protein [Paraburkholderia sp. Ac-20347]
MSQIEFKSEEKGAQRDEREVSTNSTSYRALLQKPTVWLSGNPVDRADVATVAILGYN